MAPIPPILSTSEELNLPDLDKVLSSNTIPASSDLAALNDSLANHAAAAQARADALRRDLEILQQTYAPLKAKVRKENEDARAAKAASMSRQDSNITSKSAADTGASQAPPMKKRKSDIGSITNASCLGMQVSGTSQIATDQPHSSDQPVPRISLPDRAVLTTELATTSDPEEMKRRLGVAYYPTHDLTPLLPGIPSTEDYSKQKIPNQVAMSTFQAHVDPFFRAFTEEDLGWLRDKGDRLGPFIIPPLGTHYSELWNESTDETPPPKQEMTQRPRDCAESLTDDNLQADLISCGPITSRLLSAFIKEDDNSTNGEEVDPEKEKVPKLGGFKMDYVELEEKMTSELSFIGLLDATPIDWNQTSDDEISASLRALQGQLRAQSLTNFARKQRLMNLTTDEMAKDEYTTIMDDLDKQVEQSVLKRTRSIKATKKKRVPGERGVAVTKMSIGSNIRSLLDKRQKWIQRIGSICTTEPISKTTIFKDLDEFQVDKE